jgi:hypothetical protein
MNPVQPGTGTTDGKIAGGSNLQYASVTKYRIPYYTPPLRLWGYDVGLLTQQPDRFAERFAVPIPGANEFFREVGADDPWITSLLCALEPATVTSANAAGTGDPKLYTRRVLRGNDRNSACKNTGNPYGGATATDGTVSITYP